MVVALASCGVPDTKYTMEDFGGMPDQPEIQTRSVQPTVEARFVDPVLINGKLYLEAQLKGGDSLILSGMNVRFFQDAAIFTNATRIVNVREGYGILGTPMIRTGNAASKVICGFTGASTYFNGAVQRIDPLAPKLLLNDWQTLFEVELTPKDTTKLCPLLVWEKMLDPNLGGFLAGSDGVVITVLQPNATISGPCIEKAIQLNWAYVSGVKYKYPYGTPICN